MVLSHFLSHPVRVTLSAAKLLCAVHLFETHGYQVSSTIGPSMMPTFSVDGDWIAADMSHTRNRRNALRVGDLILYRIPLDDGNGIKRLVGMPGDFVSVGTPGERGAEKMIQVGIHFTSTSTYLTIAISGTQRSLLDRGR